MSEGNLSKVAFSILKKRYEHVEKMAAAYLVYTDIPISEVRLVEQRSDDGLTVRWWFERKGPVEDWDY